MNTAAMTLAELGQLAWDAFGRNDTQDRHRLVPAGIGR